MAAVRGRYDGIVTALLASGADPNYAQPDGTTALLMAANAGDATATKALLASTPPPNVNQASAVRGSSAGCARLDYRVLSRCVIGSIRVCRV